MAARCIALPPIINNRKDKIEMREYYDFSKTKPIPRKFFKDKIAFETPKHEIYCESCETTNFYYDDNQLPFVCDRCKTVLVEKE